LYGNDDEIDCIRMGKQYKKTPLENDKRSSHLARATPAIAAHADGSRVRRLATTQR
jgi:hypothetical protein